MLFSRCQFDYHNLVYSFLDFGSSRIRCRYRHMWWYLREIRKRLECKQECQECVRVWKREWDGNEWSVHAGHRHHNCWYLRRYPMATAIIHSRSIPHDCRPSFWAHRLKNTIGPGHRWELTQPHRLSNRRKPCNTKEMLGFMCDARAIPWKFDFCIGVFVFVKWLGWKVLWAPVSSPCRFLSAVDSVDCWIIRSVASLTHTELIRIAPHRGHCFCSPLVCIFYDCRTLHFFHRRIELV